MAQDQDFIGKVAGGKMGQLMVEIADLKKLLAKADDEDRIKLLKKEIMEKETYFNILAERARLR
ncbi:MAG: hypothetical protein PHQ45_00670 [Acidaminococcaceae bacterium]|jgi:hypothetical protein|nr:hypothetical protein [Acidaminococcaceae bacterium]